jgi:acetyl esterase/lipase
MKTIATLFLSIVAFVLTGRAADVTVLPNLAYKSGASLNDYERERCVLDLYLPTNRAFATLVCFHGGGLTGGNKDGCRALGRMFVQEGIALAAANYRLSPRVKSVSPTLIIMGDHDWPARVEENQYFVALQKVAGNKNIRFLQIPDRTHGSIAGKIPEPNDPAREAMLKFIRSNGRE